MNDRQPPRATYGLSWRERHGLIRKPSEACPDCKAAEDEWCKEGCRALDTGDYR